MALTNKEIIQEYQDTLADQISKGLDEAKGHVETLKELSKKAENLKMGAPKHKKKAMKLNEALETIINFANSSVKEVEELVQKTDVSLRSKK